MMLRFDPVQATDDHIQLLYDLLKRREHFISHLETPSFSDHSHFVKNHPYLHWYLVMQGTLCHGAFYIKHDNSIGFNLLTINVEIVNFCVDFIQANLSPQPALRSMVPDFFYINVACSNTKLLDVFSEMKMLPFQTSVRL